MSSILSPSIVYLEQSIARLHGAKEENINMWSDIADKRKAMIQEITI